MRGPSSPTPGTQSEGSDKGTEGQGTVGNVFVGVVRPHSMRFVISTRRGV